ncbi:acyl-homoserine-lactone synthase [Phaeobacter gallaeciensis]|uniref:acyl-homoserine-lactone synthase n=1 Tax=Phaeobacter gallaeciensis TaxID=60890 RepID=UPI001FCD10F8|nr:acyl-homoserine-lactone synthase [Phaeobacter gallaeciensis]
MGETVAKRSRRCELIQNLRFPDRLSRIFDKLPECTFAFGLEQPTGPTMQSTEITFDNFAETGGLFTEMLRARYRHFVQLRRWNLPNVRGLEFDQYDTPESIYCTVHEEKRVLGGFRMTPTTAQCMTTSYMLRDAQLGLLPGLPSNVLDHSAPQDAAIWEVSRFFVEDTLSARDRMDVRGHLERGLTRLAQEWNISAFLCITSVTAALLMRRARLSITSAGPRFEAGGEICQAYHLTVDAKGQRSDANAA